MKTIYILICGLFLFMGCEKKETSAMSTVTFTMPDLSVNQIYSRAASAPSTISDVNCFAVMMTGPEPALTRTSCTVVDSVGSQVSTAKKMGLFRGLVPSGSSISLSIPAGVQRQFTLLGVKANPITACMDVTSQFSSADFTSDLFVVGESSAVDLQPGVTVNVPISLPAAGSTFNTGSPRLGDCTGPDSPFKARILPTKANVVKDSFPYDVLRLNNCNPIKVEFTDDNGRIGATTTSYNMTLEQATVTSGVVSSYSTSNLYTNSSCSTNISSEFSVPANTKTLMFYSYSVASSADAYKFRLKPGTTNPAPYAETITDNFVLAKYAEGALEVFGARRVVPDMCYDMSGYFKNTNLVAISGTAYSVSYPDIEGKLFPGKDCTATPHVSGTAYTLTNIDTNFDFSMRYTQDVFAATYFTLFPTVTTTSATVFGKYPVQVVGGSHNPVFLRPELPEFIPVSTTGCFGPFQVVIENERGAALVTEGAIVVSLASGAPSNLKIFNNSFCNQNYASSFADDYRKVFYIGVSTTAIVSPQSVNVLTTGQIDHPDNLGNATYTTSLTTVVPLQFK